MESSCLDLASPAKQASGPSRRVRGSRTADSALFRELTQSYNPDESLFLQFQRELTFVSGWPGRNHLHNSPELLYIIGAFLGDGCAYSWKPGYYQIGLYGEEDFAEKCAQRLSHCLDRIIRFYPNRRQNVWFVLVYHVPLYFILKAIRDDLSQLDGFLRQGNDRQNALSFIEGFFDAEGCIKIIKEPSRKTPKICIDFCNTNYDYLELIRLLLRKHLEIDARFSTQLYLKTHDGCKRKTTYHLRIYRKASVHRFLTAISTIKLKKEKKIYVENWFKLSHLELALANNSPT